MQLCKTLSSVPADTKLIVYQTLLWFDKHFSTDLMHTILLSRDSADYLRSKVQYSVLRAKLGKIYLCLLRCEFWILQRSWEQNLSHSFQHDWWSKSLLPRTKQRQTQLSCHCKVTQCKTVHCASFRLYNSLKCIAAFFIRWRWAFVKIIRISFFFNRVIKIKKIKKKT